MAQYDGMIEADLRRRCAELEALVDRLPETQDGVRVVPGMSIYLLRDGEIFEILVTEIQHYDGAWEVYYDWDCYPVDECYSTREAAEAAGEENT